MIIILLIIVIIFYYRFFLKFCKKCGSRNIIYKDRKRAFCLDCKEWFKNK